MYINAVLFIKSYNNMNNKNSMDFKNLTLVWVDDDTKVSQKNQCIKK